MVKLTSLSHGAGCACKLGLRDLEGVLGLLGAPAAHPDVLVGLLEGDDAAVVSLGGDAILVLTVDFFTPLVDDPFDWGRIAAANAASDVYAMGARPVAALNVVAWPRDKLPLELLAEVLRGGRDVAERGGFVICGGHTIDDPEPKYGLVVAGFGRRDELITIDRARPGDALVLTKALGTGIITTALKHEAVSEDVLRAAVESMTELSDRAAGALVASGVRAATDVTGFGLLGHLHRLLRASGVAAEVYAGSVPPLPGARELARAGFVPGGTRRNAEAVKPWVDWGGVDEVTRTLLVDAQTSGGLLAACPPQAQGPVLEVLGAGAAVVGRVVEGEPGRMVVRGGR